MVDEATAVEEVASGATGAASRPKSEFRVYTLSSDTVAAFPQTFPTNKCV